MEFKSSTYISDRDRIERALQIFLDLEETFKPILDNINELLDLPNLISQFDPDTVALLKDIAENLEEIIKVSTVEFGVDDGYVSWRFATDRDWAPRLRMDELKGDEGTGIEIAGSVDEYADLPEDLGNEDAGKLYLVKDHGLFYVWDGTSFPSEADGIDLQGPPGTTLFSELEDDPKDNALLSDYLDGKADKNNPVFTGNTGIRTPFNKIINRHLLDIGGSNGGGFVVELGGSTGIIDATGVIEGTGSFSTTRNSLRYEFVFVDNSEYTRFAGVGLQNSLISTRPVSYTRDGETRRGIHFYGTALNWYPSRIWFSGIVGQGQAVPTGYRANQVTDITPISYSNSFVMDVPTSIRATDYLSGEHRLTNKADKLQTWKHITEDTTIADDGYDVYRNTTNHDIIITLTNELPEGSWKVLRQRDEGRFILDPGTTFINGPTETTGPDSALMLVRVGTSTWEVYGG